MQPYSQDLRERVLWALDRGERPSSIARRLEVSRVWVYQVRDRAQKSGKRTSFQIGGHRRSRVAELESVLRAWIEVEPDLALSELSARLAKQDVVIKPGALWHQLNKWHLTFKKNPARQRARARGRAASAASMGRSITGDGCRKARIY
jgi:transposase